MGAKALLVNQGERLVSENLGPTSLQALSLLRRHQELGLPEALLRVSYSEHPPLPRPGAAPTTFYYIIPTLPQAGEGFLRTNQSFLSIGACCALGREFLDAGYDVAIDDVMFPGTFDTSWRSNLAGIEWRLVIIHPTLEETLARSSSREKSVPDHLIREQHQETSGWPERYKIDTTGLSIGDSLKLVEAALIQ